MSATVLLDVPVRGDDHRTALIAHPDQLVQVVRFVLEKGGDGGTFHMRKNESFRDLVKLRL